MKKIALALLLLATPALAAPSLKDNMKSLGSLYKSVKASMADRGQNAANAASADKMVALFKTVRGQVPDTIDQLPPGQKAAALADFQRLIDEETQFALSLKAAFLAGNNAAAAGIVNKMDLGKKEGHDKYNDN